MGKKEIGDSFPLALERGELSLHYQPQVTRRHGIIGLEALLRWDSPVFGPVAPAQFIPIAEETGLIVPLGAWVLREVCRQHKLWQCRGYAPVRAAVNVSVLQFSQPDFVFVVEQALREFNLDSGWLELELTESLFMRHTDDAVNKLDQLRRMGVKIAIDDFGTGYSCLAYLHRLPLDTLKIPQAFVKDLNPDSLSTNGKDSRTAVIRAIITMAHNLGMNVLAEGVETELQRDFLERFGCERMQGYLFAPPRPADEIERMLAMSRLFSSTPLALSA